MIVTRDMVVRCVNIQNCRTAKQTGTTLWQWPKGGRSITQQSNAATNFDQWSEVWWRERIFLPLNAHVVIGGRTLDYEHFIYPYCINDNLVSLDEGATVS